MTEEQIRIEELERELRQLRQQLEEAKASNIAKETFLSNMSHDIRTPMNAIVGMTALAKKHIDEKARVADALNKIETASAHLLELINGVLDMSRINSGRMSLVSERFSLSDLLHETMTIVRPQIEQKGHRYTLSTENIAAESFYGDSLRIRQILVNILNNAVKYTPDGGRIDIRVSESLEGDLCRLCFVCRDNGVGMSEDFLKRIFEPFERVNSTTNSRIEGTGLGMSIVKKLVETMHGTIDIASAPGEGTEVTLVFPLPFEAETVQTEALRGKRLLILEADEELRAAYRQYLGEQQINYRLVASAAEAFDALADADIAGQEIHALLIGRARQDSGSLFDIARHLSRAFPSLRLLLVSDDNWAEIEYRAERCGVSGFLPLPFFRKSLLKGLNSLFADGGEAEGAAAADLEGMRILLVEDNFINREIAREILSSAHAAVDEAEDGMQALDRFLSAAPGTYDVILMDIQMPVMDGYTAAERIRGSGRSDSESVAIYAMTANTFAEDIARARSAGMDGHLAKPIDINILLQTLRRLRR